MRFNIVAVIYASFLFFASAQGAYALAGFGNIAYDPANYVQSVITVARLLEQTNYPAWLLSNQMISKTQVLVNNGRQGWPRCWRDDECPGFYLNVMTRQGNAVVSVGSTCTGDWQHIWRRPDARGTIRQWLDKEASTASGSLCILLHPYVDEIRISSTGGNCGFEGDDGFTTASRPGNDVVLKRTNGGASSAILPGCHARIGNKEIGEVTYGGIALDFADGFSFGDSYATGYFYGVYDGFGSNRVKPFGASVYAISEFNTYHYRIEILANGQSGWTWGTTGRDER